MSQKVHVSSSVGHNGPLASGSREISSTRSARCIQTASGPLQHVRTCRRPHSHPPQSCKTARAAASRERRREPRAAEAAENAASRPLMDRTGWVRGGDRSAGQPMQRSGWIRAARYIAESFWRSVIVAERARSKTSGPIATASRAAAAVTSTKATVQETRGSSSGNTRGSGRGAGAATRRRGGGGREGSRSSRAR